MPLIHLSLENPNSLTSSYLEASEQPDIGRDLVRCCAKTRQRRQDIDVDLARIRLGRDRVGVLKPAQFGDPFIQRLHFPVVTIKEGQETGLGARRSFHTTEANVVPCPFEVPKVPKEFLSRRTSTAFTWYTP